MDHDITEKKKVIDASRKLKNNKASAQDLIENEMIKSVLPVLIKQIVKLFNIILSTGQGSKLDTNNYRGITLSRCFGKLFCHVVNERIVSYVDTVLFL